MLIEQLNRMRILKITLQKIIEYRSYIALTTVVLLPFIVYFYMWITISDNKVNRTYSVTARSIKLTPRSDTDAKLLIIPETIKVSDTKPRYMDFSTIITLLTTISIIAAYVFNPVVNRKLKLINTKIDGVGQQNDKDHTLLMSRLATIEKVTDRYVASTVLNNKLNSILTDALKYCNDIDLSSYLNHDVDNYINLVRHIDAVGVINIDAIDLTIKFKHICDNNTDALNKYLGCEFRKKLQPLLTAHMNGFKNKVFDIKNDKLTNNKDSRFKLYSETFLHDHISFIMHEHYNYKIPTTDDKA